MNEATVSSTAPKKPRSWLKIFGWMLGAVVVLLLAGYFVGTSAAFFKGVILPQASKAINAEVTVTDASISPFSQVVLRNLKVQVKGAEPLVTAAELRVRYSLMDIIRGKISIAEAALVSPTISIVENADGTSNLDAFKRLAGNEEKPAVSSKPSKVPVIDVKAVNLQNATVKQLKNLKGGGRELLELSNVNVRLADLKYGQPGRLNLSADVNVDNNPPSPGTNSSLQARLIGDFTFDLSQDLKPTAVKGSAALVVEKAAGALSDLAAFAANLDCDATATEIKQVTLKFRMANADLGQLRVSGPFDLATVTGKLKVEIQNIDRQVLNLAGRMQGMDFGSSVLNSVNQIEIANSGKTVVIAGQLTGTTLSVSQKGLTTPPLDLQVAYNLGVDQTKQTASIQTLTTEVTRNQRPLLKGALSKPMSLEWAKGANAVQESAFNLTLSDLNLADWRAFLGTNVSSGQVNGKLDIISLQGGRQLQFSIASEGSDLSAAYSSNRVEAAGFNLGLRGTLAEFQKLQLGNAELKLSQRGQPVASAVASGLFDLKTLDASFGVKLDAPLPSLASLAGMPAFEANAGSLTFDGHITQTNVTPAQAKSPSYVQKVDGQLSLMAFTGRYADYRFDRLESTLASDLEMKNQQAAIRKLHGFLRLAGQSGGTFDVNGSYNLVNQSGNLSLKLTDLNENALRPFLASALGDKKLVSVAINASLDGNYDAKGDSALKGDLRIANLIINDPRGQIPTTPLDVALACDVGMKNQEAIIRKLSGALKQSDLAAGAFEVTGSCSLATQVGNLSLKLTDLNQNGLSPFLVSALGDKKLVSVAINASLDGRYDAKAESSIKGYLQVTNLVVNDPTGRIPSTPLEARLNWDAGLRKQQALIRDFVLTLTPTERAKNELALKGQVEFSQSDAVQGGLKLSADSLDATRYYDLFSGKSKAAAQTAAAPKPGRTVSSDGNKEPGAMKLPFKSFTFDASIGRFYLREVDVANLQVSAQVDGGRVLVKPLQLTLNGAAVSGSADLDLGVPGFKYDVAFDANTVPLAPLVNSFVPERKGQIGGSTTASAQLKGAGVTGTSLQQNLAGQFGFTATNMNLSLANVRSPMINTVINVIVGIPKLLHDPNAAVGNLVGRLTGASPAHSGWADKLTASPIQGINARGNAGSGRVELQEASVRSAAFLAETAGGLTLAPVLTNSAIQFPVAVSLGRSLADEVGLVPAGTPTNAPYTRLPDFLTIRGTVGKPDPKIDKLALASVILKSGTSVAPQIGGATGGKVGSLLNTVGGLLGGGAAPATSNADRTGATQTNAPPANQPSPINPFDLFKRRH